MNNQTMVDKAAALRRAGHRHVYKADSCIICDRVLGRDPENPE